MCYHFVFRRNGVVKFVTNHVASKSEVPLLCPKATSAIKRLSPHEEEDEEGGGSDFEANGLPIASREALCSLSTPGVSGVASMGEDGDVSSEEDSQACSGEDYQDVEHHDINHNLEDSQCSAMEVRIEDEKCDFELTDILESLGDVLECVFDESESSGVHYIGVMEDRALVLATVPKTKRVLSHNTLSALNVDDGRSKDKPKRAKSSNTKELSSVGTTLLSSFSLGSPALQTYTVALSVRKFRDESPAILSNEGEDLDRQLGEELDSHYQTDQIDGDRNDTPVPLLTPPGSPLTVEWEGNTTTICEWPSNLIVDSAMQAANELRPMSPTSLENLERDEQDRVAMAEGGNVISSTLTPLLRSIYVGRTWE
jgi:hypothetical protein